MLEIPQELLPDVDHLSEMSFNYYDNITKTREFNMKDIENFIVPSQKKTLLDSLEKINARKLFPKTIIQFIHMLKTASFIKGEIINLHVCDENNIILFTTRRRYYVKFGTSSEHFHPVLTIYGEDEVNVSPSKTTTITNQITYVVLRGKINGEYYLLIIDSKKEFFNGEIKYLTYATYAHRNEFCKRDVANIHKFRNDVLIADVTYESGSIMHNNSARNFVENLVLVYDFKLADDMYQSFKSRIEKKDIPIKYVKSFLITIYGKGGMVFSGVQYIRGVLANVSFTTNKGQWFISRNMWIFQDLFIRIKSEDSYITVMNSITFKDDENFEFNVSNFEFNPDYNYWDILEIVSLVKKEYMPKFFPEENKKDV